MLVTASEQFCLGLGKQAGQKFEASLIIELRVAKVFNEDPIAKQLAGNLKRRLEFLTGLFTKGKAKLLAGGDKQGTNFLKVLLENGRLSVLPEIAAHFEALKAKIENSVDATVTSATKLSKKQVQKIAAALKKRLGRDVRIETEIDVSLIGGAVIRAGDVVIDGSLRARLEGLATALTK